jgi:hypothetical protein
VSKRRREAPAGVEAAPPPARDSDRGRDGMGLPVQLGLLTAVFAITVGIAEVAGAANLGVSFGIGQVVFALVLIVLLIRA